MTMHRIILDTLWTIASEALCLSTNAVSLPAAMQAKPKMVVIVVVLLFQWMG